MLEAAKVDALRSGAEARFQAAVAAEDAGLAQYVDERERSAGTAAVELQRASADRERRWARESVEAERKKKADEQRLKAIRSKA